MRGHEMLETIENLDPAYIEAAAKKPKRKGPGWVKWSAIAACLCLVISLGILIHNANNNNGAGFWGNGNSSVYDPHRSDFSPHIESAILKQFGDSSEIKKAYLLRTNEWFLNPQLTDFSQAVSTDFMYVGPDREQSNANSKAYSFYRTDETGKIEWVGSAYPPADAASPFGFSGLTYEMIDLALENIEYQDYIITYAQRLNTVFIWVRCETEDVILSYPTRPDLLGIKIGGIYTLEELQAILTNAYNQ